MKFLYIKLNGRLEDLEEAVRVCREAVNLTPTDSPARPRRLSMLSSRLTACYQRTDRMDDLNEAIRLDYDALDRTPSESPERPYLLHNLAFSLTVRYERTNKLDDLDKAISLTYEGLDRLPPESSERPSLLDSQISRLNDRYERTKCIEDLERAVRLSDELLSTLESGLSYSPRIYQLRHQGRFSLHYVNCVDTYQRAGRIEQALVAAESTKSRVLSAILALENLPTPATIPPALAQKERSLALELFSSDNIMLAHEELHIPQMESQSLERLQYRQALINELQDVWRHLETYGPQAAEYVGLRRGDRLSWDGIVRLAGSLGPDTVLLSLFITGKRTLLFILQQPINGCAVFEIPLDDDGWVQLLKSYEKEIINFNSRENLEETWIVPLQPLLEAVKPYANAARRVIVVPEAAAYFIPWEMLALRAGWNVPVATVPSMKWLAQLRQRASLEKEAALVVGNPDGSLKYAEEEAQRVAEMLGTIPLIGKKASKEIVLERLSESRIAHFATHAYFAEWNPLLDSGIVLADGVLTIRDILQRGLRVPNFVALSGCETGVSALTYNANELAGLSEGFLYAGAQSLLVSSWKIDDRSTASLISTFYRRWLENGEDRATALRYAMEATRANRHWVHPYYWGSFKMVGEWS